MAKNKIRMDITNIQISSLPLLYCPLVYLPIANRRIRKPFSIIEYQRSSKMRNTRNEKRKIDKSYFAVGRRKKRKITIKILSIGSAVIAAFIAMVIMTGASITSHDDKSLVMHLHPVLNIVVNGKSITVPKNIGIDSPLHKDHSLDQYGTNGVSPLHTHDYSGTIHIESTANRNYTLGEFLNVWGIDLEGKTVKATVDGTIVSDYTNHILQDGQNLNLYIT